MSALTRYLPGVIAVLLLMAPFVTLAIRQGTFSPFSNRKLLRALLHTIIYQTAIALVLITTNLMIDYYIYQKAVWSASDLSSTLVDIGLYYIVLGLFFHLPIWVISTLISSLVFLRHKIQQRNEAGA